MPGFPAAPINGVPEALENMQAHARDLVVQLEHPVLGAVRSIANPIKFSDTPASYRLAPPLLGEHTNDILQSLGYSGDDAEALATGFAI
jgi:crotonobetainyl-CoA:carnitine CoA-transferase CaiB-like acyl-CoA transferase